MFTDRIKNLTVGLLVTSLSAFAGSARGAIRRLDGSTISIADAEAAARKTLADAHVTGAQIAVLNHGRSIWSFAYGLRQQPDLAMDRETTTWAASITKSVFATYVMKLVERGEFSLDAPVVKLLPKPLNAYEPYRDKATDIVKDPRWAFVTPRMLLAHASGLANFAAMEPDKKMHLRFTPGTQFLYSGEGFNLLQFVIEEQKHQPLDTLMDAELFIPLHMTRTGLIFRKQFESDIADRFDRNEKFLAQTRRFPARGAGSMTTSAEDLARFAEMLLAGKVIGARTMRAMLRPYLEIHSLHQFPLAANEAETKNDGLAYGAGWGLLTRSRFGPAFFKEGHGDGAQTFMICFEESRSCMIILTNSDNGEIVFRPLLEMVLGDTVTPWEWEGYTPSYIERSREGTR